MNKKVNIIFTFPRCSTHFIWGELVKSGKFQLIYDADRIPALALLAREYREKIDCLCASKNDDFFPENPNYNFQYNSLAGWAEVPLTAGEHLEKLMRKYGGSSAEETFYRAMESQANGEKELFSINRFIYTYYYHRLFDGFEWTTDHAINACDELFRLLRPFDTRYVLVIRKYADWSRSRRMMGPWSDTFKDRRALSTVTMHLSRKGVPVFYMEDVIRTIKNGCLKFWEKIPPLSREEIELFCRGVDSADGEEVPAGKNVRSAYLRVGRVVSYMTEKCPFRRLALVPSIGSVPLWLLRVLPFLRDRIRTDIRKGILNNARVNIVKSQGEEMHGY